MRGSLWYQGDGNANEGRHDVGGNRAEPTAENAGTCHECLKADVQTLWAFDFFTNGVTGVALRRNRDPLYNARSGLYVVCDADQISPKN